MNKIYQRILSKVKERWLVVSPKEFHQFSHAAILGAIILAAFLSFSGISSALDPGALPTGGKITSGKGSFATTGSQMRGINPPKRLLPTGILLTSEQKQPSLLSSPILRKRL